VDIFCECLILDPDTSEDPRREGGAAEPAELRSGAEPSPDLCCNYVGGARNSAAAARVLRVPKSMQTECDNEGVVGVVLVRDAASTTPPIELIRRNFSPRGNYIYFTRTRQVLCVSFKSRLQTIDLINYAAAAASIC
jgi:hypothetical protein